MINFVGRFVPVIDSAWSAARCRQVRYDDLSGQVHWQVRADVRAELEPGGREVHHEISIDIYMQVESIYD